MDEYSCEICDSEYDDQDIVPKVLGCGQTTLCSQCLNKLIGSNPSCPKCRSSIANNSAGYPTNFAVLRLLSDRKSYTSLASHLQCRISTLKNKLNIKKDDLLRTKNQTSSSLETIKSNLSRLQELIETENDDFNIRKANEMLDKIEEEYKKIETGSPFNYWKTRISVTVNLKSYEKKENYLEEIYQRIVSEEPVYAVALIEDRVKYGKLSVVNNLILVHSLDLSEIPNNSCTVWFSDMKTTSESKKVNAFLKLSCNSKGVNQIVQIQIVDTILAIHFLKLCSGECGPSYKGATYVQEKDKSTLRAILKIDNFSHYNTEIRGSIDYVLQFENEKRNFQVVMNKVYVLGSNDGTFGIFESISQNSQINVIGEVLSPSNFQEIITFEGENKNKIVDCGFFFEL